MSGGYRRLLRSEVISCTGWNNKYNSIHFLSNLNVSYFYSFFIMNNIFETLILLIQMKNRNRNIVCYFKVYAELR